MAGREEKKKPSLWRAFLGIDGVDRKIGNNGWGGVIAGHSRPKDKEKRKDKENWTYLLAEGKTAEGLPERIGGVPTAKAHHYTGKATKKKRRTETARSSSVSRRQEEGSEGEGEKEEEEQEPKQHRWGDKKKLDKSFVPRPRSAAPPRPSSRAQSEVSAAGDHAGSVRGGGGGGACRRLVSGRDSGRPVDHGDDAADAAADDDRSVSGVSGAPTLGPDDSISMVGEQVEEGRVGGGRPRVSHKESTRRSERLMRREESMRGERSMRREESTSGERSRRREESTKGERPKKKTKQAPPDWMVSLVRNI